MLGPVVCDIAGKEPDARDIRRIRHPLTGMVILFTRNYESPEQLKKLTDAIHAAKPGVLISVDHEGGRVQRFREGFTEIPAMSCFGAIAAGDPERAAKALAAAGFILAAELRACGVDMTFAPVLDLDWGRSAIIGERSLARDPRMTARLARAIISGFSAAGMASCGKHFPGHGWALADSHMELPTDGRAAGEICGIDARPYEWLGVALASVMTAHILYPNLDPEVPATFSRKIVTGLLREQLGFTGLVFSDDLSMAGAAAAGDIAERGEAALAAGCDALIACNDPDAEERLLDGLRWEPSKLFLERSIRVHPRGGFPGLAELKEGETYRVARRTLEETFS